MVPIHASKDELQRHRTRSAFVRLKMHVDSGNFILFSFWRTRRDWVGQICSGKGNWTEFSSAWVRLFGVGIRKGIGLMRNLLLGLGPVGWEFNWIAMGNPQKRKTTQINIVQGLNKMNKTNQLLNLLILRK